MTFFHFVRGRDQEPICYSKDDEDDTLFHLLVREEDRLWAPGFYAYGPPPHRRSSHVIGLGPAPPLHSEPENSAEPNYHS